MQPTTHSNKSSSSSSTWNAADAVSTHSTSSAAGDASLPLILGIIAEHDHAFTPELARKRTGALLDALRARYRSLPFTVLCAGHNAIERAALAAASARAIGTRPVPPGDRRAHLARWSDVVIELGTPSAAYHVHHDPRAGHAHTARTNARALLAPPDVRPRFVLAPDGEGADAMAPVHEAALRQRERFVRDLGPLDAADGEAFAERVRERTDRLANRLQRLARFWQLTLFVMAFIAATAQVIDIGYSAQLKVATLVAALLVYLFVRARDYQNRYQDYRAIGEALRVRAAWCASGIAEGVHESYLAMQQTDLQWIRDVLRTVTLLDPASERPDASIDPMLAWARSQHEYFTARARSEAHRRDRLHHGGFALAAISFVASALALAGGVTWMHVGPLLPVTGIVAALGALGVAILHSYAEARGYSENANRYARMRSVFGRALQLFDELRDDSPARRAIALELGREALTEQADWLLAQRVRPISVVHVGVG